MSLLTNTTAKASAKNARELIIFSYPKVGKTELLTKLPGKYVILDFEGGTDFYDCEKVSVPNLDVFNQLRNELETTKPHYDFIVVDTFTSMYSGIINAIAVTLYNKDQKKSKPVDWDIDKLDYGKGHIYKREAVSKVTSFLKQFCNCLILSGHVKDASLDGESGKITVKDIDVEGKLKNILALKTDAIGLLYRSKENNNQNILSFTASTGQVGGTRIQHLANKEIVISEKKADGTLETNWDKIFIK